MTIRKFIKRRRRQNVTTGTLPREAPSPSSGGRAFFRMKRSGGPIKLPTAAKTSIPLHEGDGSGLGRSMKTAEAVVSDSFSGPFTQHFERISCDDKKNRYDTTSHFSGGQGLCKDSCDDDNAHSGQENLEGRLDFSNLKLNSRKRELQILRDVYSHVERSAFDADSTETSVVTVRGISGTGKSTLVRQFMEDLDKESRAIGGPTKPYLLWGKYDELSGGDPFSAIVEAFGGFAQSLLLDIEDQRGGVAQAELQLIRGAIETALGSEARLMATIVPGLRDLILSKDDNTSPVVEGPPSEKSLNRLKYVFQAFSNAICSTNRPVVLFLDDLQWSDTASLELLETLLTDKDLRHFMFIGSYRSNEVKPEGELMTRLEAIGKVQGIKDIELSNLSLVELNEFMADALRVDKRNRYRALPLTAAVYSKTKGNVFFSVQLLEELQRKGVVTFSRVAFEWEWDLDSIDEVVSDDVIATVTSKIKSSPDLLQRVMILMAYTRSTVDIETIRLLLDMDGCTVTTEKLAKLLDGGVLDGLLANRMGLDSYSFAHDRIQQASYRMVPLGKERGEFRFKLGRHQHAIASSDFSNKSWLLFIAADHLNATCVQLKSMGIDELFLIKINLEAGTRAASVAAFETAVKFLGLALRDLSERVEDSWKNEYDITLKAHEGMVNARLCQGHFESGLDVANQLLVHAKTLEDKLPTQIALSRAHGRQSEYPEAHQLAHSVICGLNEFPKHSVGVTYHLIKDLIYLKKYFRSHSNEDIIKLPVVKDKKMITTMKMFTEFGLMAYFANRKVEYLVANTKQIRLTFEHGLFITTPLAITTYCIFSQAMNDKEAVARFSRLATDIVDKVKSKEVEGRQSFLAAYFIHAWREPPHKVVEVYKRGQKAGMEAGDFEAAFACSLSCTHYLTICGFPLQELAWKYTRIMEGIERFKVKNMGPRCAQRLFLVRHLMGTSERPISLEELGNSGFIKSGESLSIIQGCLARIQLGIHFGEYDLAEKMIDAGAAAQWETDESYTITNLRLFLSAIVYATLARKKLGRKRTYLKKARRCSKALNRLYKLKGMKGYHRYLLSEAQISAATDGTSISVQYGKAISAALKTGHINDAGLGSQLAAEYFLDMENDALSSILMRQLRKKLVRENLEAARDLYLKWGANGLVNHLETKHNEYLQHTSGLFNDQSISTGANLCSSDSFREKRNSGMDRMDLPANIVGPLNKEGNMDDYSLLTDNFEHSTVLHDEEIASSQIGEAFSIENSPSRRRTEIAL